MDKNYILRMVVHKPCKTFYILRRDSDNVILFYVYEIDQIMKFKERQNKYILQLAMSNINVNFLIRNYRLRCILEDKLFMTQ